MKVVQIEYIFQKKMGVVAVVNALCAAGYHDNGILAVNGDSAMWVDHNSSAVGCSLLHLTRDADGVILASFDAVPLRVWVRDIHSQDDELELLDSVHDLSRLTWPYQLQDLFQRNGIMEPVYAINTEESTFLTHNDDQHLFTEYKYFVYHGEMIYDPRPVNTFWKD